MQQAGDAEGAAKKKTSRRTWLLRIGAVLLVMTFLSPTCFTRRLWDTYSEDRRSIDRAEPPELQAFRQGRADGRVTMRLPAEMAARFVELPHPAGADPVWLAATPQEHTGTAVHLLASAEAMEAAARRITIDATWAPSGLHLERVDSCDGKTATWWLAFDYPARHAERGMASMPGFRKHHGIYTKLVFRARCRIEVLTTPPGEPGVSLPGFAMQRSRALHGEMSEAERMLLTPITALGDLLTAPLQLLFWGFG